MKASKYILLLIILNCSLSVNAALREYKADFKTTEWTVALKKQVSCELSQEIPNYGKVSFFQKSGHDLKFKAHSYDFLSNNSLVSIISEPLPWRHNDISKRIKDETLKKGKQTLEVATPYSQQVYRSIESSLAISINYLDLDTNQQLIKLVASPLRFIESSTKFKQCKSTLFIYDPDEIKDFNIYFATNKAILSKRAKKLLKYVSDHLKVDKKLIQVRIDAHADDRGRRRFNDKLSIRRGEAIQKYLKSLDVDLAIVYLKAHGERKPEHNNKSKLGRAKNRQAQIQMLTTPVPPPEVKVKVSKEKEKEEEFKPSDSQTTPVPSFINMQHLITQ